MESNRDHPGQEPFSKANIWVYKITANSTATGIRGRILGRILDWWKKHGNQSPSAGRVLPQAVHSFFIFFFSYLLMIVFVKIPGMFNTCYRLFELKALVWYLWQTVFHCNLRRMPDDIKSTFELLFMVTSPLLLLFI
jgi:hypothetical protein